jgi:ABC-type lipoprotein release transport system permease subunit
MLVLKLAWRSLWRNRRRTLISVLSLAFGLLLAVTFIAVADGVYARLIDDAVRLQGGHITLEHPRYREAPAIDLNLAASPVLRKQIERLPGVERTKALVLGQGVAKTGSGAVGVAVVGVEPDIERRTSPVPNKIVRGSYLTGTRRQEVLVGADLAKQLKLDIGKKMVITTNDAQGNLVEELYRVSGIFRLGTEEIDGYLVQLPLAAAQRLYRLPDGRVTQLGVILRDVDDKARLLPAVAALAGPGVAVLPWDEVMPELAGYIRMDGGSNMVLQGILLFLILFTVFNTLLMSVLERRREIGVVLALGTPPGRIKLQILTESALLAFLGCFVGLLAGGLLSYYLAVYGLDLRQFMKGDMAISGVAVSPIVHARLTASLLGWLGGGTFLATLLISLYPMHKAARIQVADVIKTR